MAKDDAQRIRGDRLRAIRKAGEFDTPEKLAVAAGVSHRTVTRAEAGQGTYEVVEKLALALRVAPSMLWVPLPGTVGDADSDPVAVAVAEPSLSSIANAIASVDVKLGLIAGKVFP